MPRINSALSYLILLGGALTVALSFYIVISTYSSLPYWDGWTQIEVAANGRSPLSPSWLWEQHNEHRLVIPKLFLAVDLLFFRARQAFLLTSILVIQLLHLALLSWSMRALGGWKGALWRAGTGVAAFCLFCPTQSENLTWGFQVCFVLPPFFATLSFAALLLYGKETLQVEGKGAPRFLLVSILAAFGAAYSLAAGCLVWPLLVAEAAYLRLGRRIMGIVSAAGAISIGLYAWHYARPEGHGSPVAALSDPLGMLKYCAAYFLSSWPYYGARGHLLLRLVVVVFFLALLVSALPSIGRFRPFAAQLGLTVMYCLATSLITAMGRLNFGVTQATVSRYQTVALLGWSCLGLLMLGGLSLAGERMRYLFPVAQLSVLAVFAIGASRAEYQVLITRGHAFAQKAASAALLTGMADREALGQVYPEKEMFAKTVPYMRTNGLSAFSDRLASAMGKPLNSTFRPADSSECAGALEKVFPISETYGGGLGPGLEVVGWAKDNKRNKIPSAIVVTLDDKVVGLGATGRWRPPGFDGFEAFSPELAPQAEARFYAILDRAAPAACYLARLYLK